MVFTSTLITVVLLAAVCPLTGAEAPFFADETSVLQVAQHERDLKEHDIAGTRHGTEAGAQQPCLKRQQRQVEGWNIGCDEQSGQWFYSAIDHDQQVWLPDQAEKVNAGKVPNPFEEARHTPEHDQQIQLLSAIGSSSQHHAKGAEVDHVKILVMTLNGGNLQPEEVVEVVNKMCAEIQKRKIDDKNPLDIIMLASQDFDSQVLRGKQWPVAEPGPAGATMNTPGRPLKYCGLKGYGYHQTEGLFLQTEKDKYSGASNGVGTMAEDSLSSVVKNRVEIAYSWGGGLEGEPAIRAALEYQLNGPSLGDINSYDLTGTATRYGFVDTTTSYMTIPVKGLEFRFMSVHLDPKPREQLKKVGAAILGKEKKQKGKTRGSTYATGVTIVAGDFAKKLKYSQKGTKEMSESKCREDVLRGYKMDASGKVQASDRDEGDGLDLLCQADADGNMNLGLLDFFTVVSNSDDFIVDVKDPRSEFFSLTSEHRFTSGVVTVSRAA